MNFYIENVEIFKFKWFYHVFISEFLTQNLQQNKINMLGYPYHYPYLYSMNPYMYHSFLYEPPLPETPPLKIEEKLEEVQEAQENIISEQFLQIFEEQLKEKRKKENTKGLRQIKKFWTKEECNLLIQMKNQNFKWPYISQRIPNASWQVCRRKYYMLIEEKEKWPPELDEEIKHLCNNQNLQWNDKLKQLREKFPQTQNYSSTRIKNRYLLYLKDDAKQEPWTVEEDMALLRMKKGIKRWKQITEVLPGRTEPQMQNRYYSYVREIEKKVEKKLKQNKVKLEKLKLSQQ